MKQIFDYLREPSWWFSSVLVALLINFVSHYLIQIVSQWREKALLSPIQETTKDVSIELHAQRLLLNSSANKVNAFVAKQLSDAKLGLFAAAFALCLGGSRLLWPHPDLDSSSRSIIAVLGDTFAIFLGAVSFLFGIRTYAYARKLANAIARINKAQSSNG